MNKYLLQYEMKRSGVTAEGMCKKIGMSTSSFSRKCNGHSEFTLSEVKKIMEILSIDSPDAIFFTEKV